jgi:Sigma-70 region 3
MRGEVARVLAVLLASSESSKDVSLDQIGDAIGTIAITAEEIERLIDALEAKGRRVSGPSGGGGESRLKVVIATARALTAELGRKPSPAEIASRTELTETDVRYALALAKVIARG